MTQDLKDKRRIALKKGLGQLTCEQLQRILDTEDIVCDSVWYDPTTNRW